MVFSLRTRITECLYLLQSKSKISNLVAHTAMQDKTQKFDTMNKQMQTQRQ